MNHTKSKPSRLSGRRMFFKKMSGLAVAGMTALSYRRVMGANERVRLALIGCGGRGEWVARGFVEDGHEFAHLVDPCDSHAQRVGKILQEQQNLKPGLGKTALAAMQDSSVDAVVIATPDHWHALLFLQACMAEKDIYLEKPQSHNIHEGRLMVQAAKKYNRIVQIGAQNRSALYNFAARDVVQSGNLGDIRLVKVYHMKPNASFHERNQPYSLANPEPSPDDLDWNLWLGPAPYREYHQNIFHHYGWTAFWDFSVGDLNDGIHQIDLSMMLMGEPDPPVAVSSMGHRLHFRGDDAQPPDVMMTSFDFRDFILSLHVTGYPRYMQKTTTTIRRNDEFPYWTQNATRIELYGSRELMIVGRMGGGWITMTSGGKVVEKMFGRFPDEPHRKNFIECLKSRSRPNGEIETMNNSTNLVHLANIAHRVGNLSLTWDGDLERFVDNDAANELLQRSYRPPFVLPKIL